MGIHHVIGAAAALALFAPLPVAAAPTPTPTVQELIVTPNLGPNVQVKSQTVRFADLNVAEPAGGRALLARVKSVARTLCADPGSVFRAPERAACAKDAVDRAVVEAAIPTLTVANANPR